MQVGEVTAAAARDKNLLADLAAALDNQNAPSPFARLDGAHQTGGTAADDDYIITAHLSSERGGHRQYHFLSLKNYARVFETAYAGCCRCLYHALVFELCDLLVVISQRS